MTDYVFELDPGVVVLHTDIDYITDDSGNRIAYGDGYVIADWSVVPVNIYLSRISLALTSGVVRVAGSSINFKINFPINSNEIRIAGNDLVFGIGRYFQLDSGVVRVYGQTIAMPKSDAVNTDIILASGVVRVAGNDIDFVIDRVFPIKPSIIVDIGKGNITVSGSSIGFKLNTPLDSGVVRVIGSDITFTKFENKVFELDSGDVRTTGRDVLFLFTPVALFCGPGEVRVEGSSIDFVRRIFSLNSGFIYVGRKILDFSIQYPSTAIEVIYLNSTISLTIKPVSEICLTMELNSEILKEMKLNGNFYR